MRSTPSPKGATVDVGDGAGGTGIGEEERQRHDTRERDPNTTPETTAGTFRKRDMKVLRVKRVFSNPTVLSPGPGAKARRARGSERGSQR
jgi:hypothetical protein